MVCGENEFTPEMWRQVALICAVVVVGILVTARASAPGAARRRQEGHARGMERDFARTAFICAMLRRQYKENLEADRPLSHGIDELLQRNVPAYDRRHFTRSHLFRRWLFGLGR